MIFKLNLKQYISLELNYFSYLFESKKPFMKFKEVYILQQIIINKNPKNILEYGSGNSTLYFSKYLNIDSNWTSIESEDYWFNYVKQYIQKNNNIKIHQITDLKDYSKSPKKINPNLKYDIIIVDGRTRKKCINFSKSIIEKNGILILHDANRNYYYPKEINYKYKYSFLDERKNIKMGDGGLLILSDKELKEIEYYNKIWNLLS